MAKRTLASTWRNIERLFEQHCRRSDDVKLDDLNDLLHKVNQTTVVEALATLLVNPYHGLEEATLRFALLPDRQPPPWKTSFSGEENRLYVNVLGVFDFRRECEEAQDRLATPEARRSFHLYRYHAFMTELLKLPTHLMLFLLILEKVADVQDVSRVEKRGGDAEENEGRAYLHLLWAFKELEQFIHRNKGVDLRSEYGILWLESDWFVGR